MKERYSKWQRGIGLLLSVAMLTATGTFTILAEEAAEYMAERMQEHGAGARGAAGGSGSRESGNVESGSRRKRGAADAGANRSGGGAERERR